MNSLKRILGSIRRADQTFSLIKNDDKIALGISGGKDSMVMLKAMSIYQKFGVAKFEIFPIILDLGFPGFDASLLDEFCKELGLTLTIVNEKQVFEILSLHKKDDKLPCSICSKMKKAAINAAANSLGCNKVAFAHHADDAIETLFMNEIYGGKIATFEPKMRLVRAGITFIRPLIFAREEDIIKCVKEENIPVLKSHCPNDGFTMRSEIKDTLNNIYKNYPSSYINFLNMISRYDLEGTWKDNIIYNIEGSKYSLRPVIKKEDLLLEMNLNLSSKNYDEEYSHFLIYDKNEKLVGRICARYVNKKVYVKDIYFIRPTLLKYKKVLGYFERKALMDVNPVTINVLDRLPSEIYKPLGYKKVDKVLTKTEYVK